MHLKVSTPVEGGRERDPAETIHLTRTAEMMFVKPWDSKEGTFVVLATQIMIA